LKLSAAQDFEMHFEACHYVISTDTAV